MDWPVISSVLLFLLLGFLVRLSIILETPTLQARRREQKIISDKEIKSAIETFDDSEKNLVHNIAPRTGRLYFVTGGGGFVGSHIVKQLVLRGEKNVFILDLALKEAIDGANFVKLDITDRSRVLNVIRDIYNSLGTTNEDVTVFHVAALLSFHQNSKRDWPISYKINVDGSQNVVDAVKSLNTNTIVIYTSSPTVVQENPFLIHIWNSPYNNDDPAPSAFSPKPKNTMSNYTRSKYLGEQVVLKANGHDKLLTAAIRPSSIILGRGGGEYLIKYLQQNIPSTHTYRIANFIVVENVAASHLCLEQRLLQPNSAKFQARAFVVADSPPYSSATILNATVKLVKLATGGKWNYRYRTLPAIVVYLTTSCVELYRFLGGKPRDELKFLSFATMDHAYTDQVFDSDESMRTLQFKPPYTLLEGIYSQIMDIYLSKSKPVALPDLAKAETISIL